MESEALGTRAGTDTLIALCRICEPIAFMSIFPYIYHMVEDFHVTEDKSQISFYAGLVTSAFTFAEFSTGLLWGRLSDRIGRKPVLLTGLFGTGLSVLVFGFAPNLTVALIARALGGLLNGYGSTQIVVQA
jgi:MFS family permease